MEQDTTKRRLLPGDRAPDISQRTLSGQTVALNGTESQYTVLCFFGSSADPHAAAALSAIQSRPDLFNGTHARAFGICVDRKDEEQNRLPAPTPGFDVFFDFDNAIGLDYGSVEDAATDPKAPRKVKRMWVIAGPDMTVHATLPFRPDRTDIADVMQMLERMSPPGSAEISETIAPILYLPRVFEPDLCKHLVSLYNTNGGEESGVMRNADGLTVGVEDHSFKRRKDYLIQDKDLIATLQTRMRDRVLPHITRAYQFQVTRMERYIVSCYSAEDGGHFAPHRDDTTKGTAHRKFAVSINLNDDFDGGEVSFPEFGHRSFKAPAGGAVVFSCSLLHAVSRVTRGERYAFLPFLYDESAAKLREKNQKFMANAANGSRPEVA